MPTPLVVAIAVVSDKTITVEPPELLITSKTTPPTPTPVPPITAIELKITSIERSAEILAWAEDSLGIKGQSTQVSLYFAPSPDISSVKFRSFNTDDNGELRIKVNVKRLFRTFRKKASRKHKQLYLKACANLEQVCSKFVLLSNTKQKFRSFKPEFGVRAECCS